MIKAKNLFKAFKDPTHVQVLSDLSLEVAPGQTVAITGKSGEGKSTLLHILGTLEKACSGTLEIAGRDTAKADLYEIRNRCIGFIFQSYNLLEDETVLENVLMPAKIGRLKVSKEKGMSLLEAVGLSDRAHFMAKLLSGGEKQRAAIARALCNDPPILLADEPSGNLDHAHSTAIHELLIRSAKKYGKTLVIATHDKELASLCDTTYLLANGKLQQ
jgi:lipoprotein-releasing system ATP-binding protein